MGEAVIGATIQAVLQSLLSIAGEEISLVRGFRKDLENLRKSFVMVQNFLYDAEIHQIIDQAVKCWLKNLEDLSFEADNVLDEIHYQLLSQKVNSIIITQNKMKKKVKSLFSRIKMGRRIREIDEQLELINRRATGLGLQMRLASGSGSGSDASASVELETDSYSVDPIFRGRDDGVSSIVDLLIKSSSSSGEQRSICVLPIVGMGGLGKTTLARKVFGHEKIISHFGDNNRAWVYVSRNFDVCSVLKSILTSLTQENVELIGTKEAVLKKLQNYLGSRRFLLVLDDNWDGDREKWDGFLNSLSGISSAAGSCMIVTTRSQEVASIVKTLPIHELDSLSEEDCWSIIKAKAFSKSGDITIALERIGRNIAKRCQGLPLAAKVVGGLLRDKSKDEWLAIEKNWLPNVGDGNTISKILNLSFDNLSSPSLKKCFAYCSVFPKGHKIEKEQLIELWMAEGFLQPDQSSDMETIGIKFVNLLMRNSLLQVDFGNVITHVNMHDLVHDLACSILGENSNVKKDNDCQSRYVGYNSNGNESCSITKEQARYVRTLFFNGRVSNLRLSDFKSLHTLTLVGKDIYALPDSIGKLIHLRYLDTSETSIYIFPDSIGELYNLQTLRTRLDNLPNSFKYLHRLRHLHISIDTATPSEIGRLHSLQTLPYFHVGHEKGCQISELGRLKNLKGELDIRNLEKVRDKDEARSASIFQKPGLYNLKLVWNESKRDEANDETVLEGLQPHHNLKSLVISGFKGKSLPQWTLNMAVRDNIDGHRIGLNNLTVMSLRNCSECEEIPMLGHLPNLKFLYLHGLKNVRSISSSFYNIDNCTKLNNEACKKRDTIVVFPALEALELLDMPNLIEWATLAELRPNEGETQLLCEVVVFPCLEYLKVEDCRQLARVPTHFSCLKDLSFKGIDGLECLPGGLFSDNLYLSLLVIQNCPNLTLLIPCLQGGGASLRELRIDNCCNLREVADDLHSLSSLEYFSITDCPNLKSIPYNNNPSRGHELQGFTSLRCLIICDCEGLTNFPIEMIESCAPSLELLSLKGLSSIMNLGMVVGYLPKMPCLTTLILRDVPEFNIIDSSVHHHSNNNMEIGSLSSLHYLEMDPSSSSDTCSWTNVSFSDTVDAILQPSQFSLRELYLEGLENWDSLPDQLQHLNALSNLSLTNFGIEALPEWFGNLSSLTDLTLQVCKKLRHLPSKEAMQRLTKLTDLYVRGCPLLLKESRESTDSEWPKVFHISTVVCP